MQNDNRNDNNQYYDSFPYKSYEEIVAEKNRKRRLRKSIILLGVLFLLSAGVVMAVGLFIGGQPLRWLNNTGAEPVKQPDSQSAQEQMPETPSMPDGDGGFEMTISGTESGEAAIVVKDVSDIVKKSREAVVGVVTESYSNFSSASSGSGIILSEDGYVVTNNHVIDGATAIKVLWCRLCSMPF